MLLISPKLEKNYQQELTIHHQNGPVADLSLQNVIWN